MDLPYHDCADAKPLKVKPGGLRQAWEQTVREQGSRLVVLCCLLNDENSEKRWAEWKRVFKDTSPPPWLVEDKNMGVQWFAERRDGSDWSTEAPPGTEKLLRNYVAAWLRAGKNIYSLIHSHTSQRGSAIDHALALGISRTQMSLAFTPDGETRPIPVVDVTGADPETVLASRYFSDLLQNPLRDLLGGPCDRCGRYFLSRSGHSNKRYCTLSCKQNARKKATRIRQRSEKLKRARAELKKITADVQSLVRHRSDWKSVVAKRVGVTPKWLTRYINTNKLVVPNALDKRPIPRNTDFDPKIT